MKFSHILIAVFLAALIFGVAETTRAQAQGDNPCLDYAVLLEANSGPMPSEVVPPRYLTPPRFSCDSGFHMEATDSTGLVLCRCPR